MTEYYIPVFWICQTPNLDKILIIGAFFIAINYLGFWIWQTVIYKRSEYPKVTQRFEYALNSEYIRVPNTETF